jgi:hypothetical protein
MDPADIEAVVHRALTKLPSPRAPRSLLPRVLAVVHQPVRPWYERAWMTWPRAWQLASLTALAGLAWALVLVLPSIESLVVAVVTRVGSEFTPIAGLTGSIAVTLNAVDVLRRALAPTLGYAVSLIVMMSAACAVVGAALAHMALGGASQS